MFRLFLFREPRPDPSPEWIIRACGSLQGVSPRVALIDCRFWAHFASGGLIAFAAGILLHLLVSVHVGGHGRFAEYGARWPMFDIYAWFFNLTETPLFYRVISTFGTAAPVEHFALVAATDTA